MIFNCPVYVSHNVEKKYLGICKPATVNTLQLSHDRSKELVSKTITHTACLFYLIQQMLGK